MNRRHRVHDLTDALASVRSELGLGAMVLRIREVPAKNILGFPVASRLEVLAVREEEGRLAHSARLEDEPSERAMDRGVMSPRLLREQLWLLRQGLRAELVEGLVAGVRRHLLFDRQEEEDLLDDALSVQLARICPSGKSGIGEQGKEKVVFLVGGSGSGKTTAALRLAQAVREQHRGVTLLTLDAERPGEFQKVQALGQLLGVQVVGSSIGDGWWNAVREQAKSNTIIVDTPSLEQPTGKEHPRVAALLGGLPDPDVFLVMESTAREEEVLVMSQHLTGVDVSGLIVTRMDQCIVFGDVINVAASLCLPIVYLCQGRSPVGLPIEATPQLLVSLLHRARKWEDGAA